MNKLQCIDHLLHKENYKGVLKTFRLVANLNKVINNFGEAKNPQAVFFPEKA